MLYEVMVSFLSVNASFVYFCRGGLMLRLLDSLAKRLGFEKGMSQSQG